MFIINKIADFFKFYFKFLNKFKLIITLFLKTEIKINLDQLSFRLINQIG